MNNSLPGTQAGTQARPQALPCLKPIRTSIG